MTALLTATALHKTFAQTKALDGASFSVDQASSLP